MIDDEVQNLLDQSKERGDRWRTTMEALETKQMREQHALRLKHLNEQMEDHKKHVEELCDCNCHCGGFDKTGVCKQPCDRCQCPD